MAKANKFGTFGGVFTPSILTILGVIMYLRLPMIVGEAGLIGTLGIILIAHIISVTTGLSVSSIATDKKVEAGGTYYMISRSLGLPIGGTLGLGLFVGLSFSISLYLIGFAESFLNYLNLDTSLQSIRLTGTIVLMVVTTVTFISTSLAIKTQYIIMAAIALSLMAIFLGGNHDYAPAEALIRMPLSAKDFMLWFGIFFPAVTGFEAGVSMSGDLKDPKKSIPLGSIMAIVVGFVMYVLLAIFLSYTVSPETLKDPDVLFKITGDWKVLVVAGIWGATLSSALGSILGAPRILQATAVDKITWKFFARGVGKANEPRNALLLTFAIAEVGILIGELDIIARVVSIFFITTYGFLNLSCAFEAWTSADFRPSFKTPIWVSFLGAIACFVVMIQLDIVATLGAVVLLGGVFLYLKRKELTLQSGDAWSGVWASLVKTGLQRLNRNSLQTRNWRPNILMFNGHEETRSYMVELGLTMAGKLGILSGFELEESDETLLVKPQRNTSPEKDSPRYFRHKHVCRDIYSGMDEIARVYGFTGVEPNTILMGWTQNPDHKENFLRLIQNFQRNDYNAIFIHYDKQRKFGAGKTIDVWWSGWGRNLSLAANLLRHVTSSDRWKHPTIRLMVICQDITRIEKAYNDMVRIVDHFRIDMQIHVVNNSVDQLSRVDLMAKESAHADLTIVGIPDKRYEVLEETYDEVQALAERMGTVLFINASSVFEEYNLGLDEGRIVTAPDYEDTVPLPEVPLSRYPAIADDIVKIDDHGRQVLERFYEKAFVPFFATAQQLNEELFSLTEAMARSFDNQQDKNAYRRTEAMFRIRRHFFTDAHTILERYAAAQVKLQSENLQSGIGWYITQLDKDILRFPKRLKIRYHKDDFKIMPGDGGATKWLKFRKRMLSPFSGEFITGKIRYREVAMHYLRDSRHHFLTAWLENFEQHTQAMQEKIFSLIVFAEEQFEKLEKNPDDADVWQVAGQALTAKAMTLKEEEQQAAQRYLRRLLVEFRRNIQLLSKDLERIDINHRMDAWRKGRKYYEGLRERNEGFAHRWEALAVQTVNKSRVGIMMRAFRWQVVHDVRAFNRTFDQAIQNHVSQPVQASVETLETRLRTPQKSATPVPKVEWSVQQDILLKDFEELGEALTAYIRKLPNEIVISDTQTAPASHDEEPEGVVIPLSKITQHFLETALLSPFHDALENTLESMKGLVFNVNDQLSLALFNVENIGEEEDRPAAVERILQRTTREIEREEQQLETLKQQSDTLALRLVEDLLAPLSIYKLPKTTRDFSYLVRDYRSKRVLSRFGKWRRHVSEFVKNKILVLLYSRSEGILLAQRLAESSHLKSVNERTLALVDMVTPDTKILTQLPHYYQNLFSGRSSIGENFWVPRDTEERQVNKALDHYRLGYYGAILVLGERNSGKTALCRHIAEKQFSGQHVYHVFAPQDGSISPEDFTWEVAKATGINSDLTGIMNNIPHHAAIVLHDLELWWERSPRGMAIIDIVQKLITAYADRCLFIVNMNPFAYELVNTMNPVHDRFIAVIRCQPFSSMELKNLILTRHRSSGLTFTMENKQEAAISEIRLARLFNDYFDYSEGNPGVAMSAWLNSIRKVSGKNLVMRVPDSPSLDVFHHLPAMWSVILVQLILHKRMSTTKLERVLQADQDEVQECISVLRRAGLVNERTAGLYIVDPYVEPYIIKAFKKKEWL